MIIIICSVIIVAIWCAIEEASSFGTPAEGLVLGAFGGILIGLVINMFVSILWGGVDAKYTDITSKVEQRVVNNEAVFYFETGHGTSEWSLPVNTTKVNVGSKPQIITYSATDASAWWTVFPNVKPERSPQLVVPVS